MKTNIGIFGKGKKNPHIRIVGNPGRHGGWHVGHIFGMLRLWGLRVHVYSQMREMQMSGRDDEGRRRL